MGVALPVVSGVKTRRNSIESASGPVKPAHRQQKDIAVKGKQQNRYQLNIKVLHHKSQLNKNRRL